LMGLGVSSDAPNRAALEDRLGQALASRVDWTAVKMMERLCPGLEGRIAAQAVAATADARTEAEVVELESYWQLIFARLFLSPHLTSSYSSLLHPQPLSHLYIDSLWQAQWWIVHSRRYIWRS
jgi:hypothetical protein